ncbi:MAG: phage major capsid protein, P2 family [Ottowia sp.]|nr:phage major capsid protein, P2 family [Ottowia sp.]
MHNFTRKQFSDFQQRIAEINGVASVDSKFSVAASVQQKLENKIQESAEFLKKINVIGVVEQQGEKIGLSIAGPSASTTDTQKKEREPRSATAMESQKYHCMQTNFDTAIKYAVLDAWAKFPNFQQRIRNLITERQALDRIMIGFNGVDRAETSNSVTSPLLQDVNKGWLQHYRDISPARVMKEVKSGSGKVVIGKEGDYKNLDALVYDATNHMIDSWFQGAPGLVVLCGRDLLANKYFPLLNTLQAPSEQMAAELVINQNRIGGLPVVTAPYFPAGKLMITRLDNLSVYWQEGARRRAIIDNVKRDQIENYESSNDAYVVEDFGAGCVVENIVIEEKQA